MTTTHAIIRETAKELISSGINPVPVGPGKIPVRKRHSDLAMKPEEVNTYEWINIGASCGFISGGLEVLDIDLKHADDPDRVMRDLKKNIDENLLKKLVVQETKNGGYHFLWKSEDVQSSRKLAMNKEGEVLIETRGTGSYIKIEPSEGYKFIQGDILSVPVISPEDRLSILIASKLLNERIENGSKNRYTQEQSNYLDKFPEYDTDMSYGINLLKKHGWTVWSEDDTWVNFTRPGKKYGISGGYNKNGFFFISFTTSQDNFDTEKVYNNHAILAELEYDGNYKAAYKYLYNNGMGKDEVDEEDTGVIEIDFLVDLEDENTKLTTIMKGEVEMGKTTGWSNIDRHYRHKQNTVSVFLGADNIGKSLFVDHFITAANLLHGFKYGIVAPENATYTTRKRIIEAMSGQSLEQLNSNPRFYEKLLKRARKDFFIVKNGKHLTLADVLKMGEVLYKKKKIDYLVIDPYSFFSIGGANSFAHDNDMLSKMLVFAEEYCSILIMAHPVSSAVRENRDEHGFLTAPNKYQISGGNTFANRVHDFTVLHRIINHTDPDVRRTMQFSVEKIKEVETGGMPHIKGEWDELEFKRKHGFLGYWNGDENPIFNLMKSKHEVRPVSTDEAFEI